MKRSQRRAAAIAPRLVCRDCVVRFVILAALIGVPSLSTSAIERVWDGGGGANTNWRTDANWSDDTEPGISDTAAFILPASVAVTTLGQDTDISTDRLRVRSAVTLGVGLSATADYVLVETDTVESTRGVIVGELNGDIAVLNMNLPSLTTAAATIGHSSGSSGTFNIAGGDQFNITGSDPNNAVLIVGRSGTGQMMVQGGAVVTVANGGPEIGLNAGSTGTVTITGNGSTWINGGFLTVGDSGNGTLQISNGGQVISGFGSIGVVSGSLGNVTVTGAGSIWNVGSTIYAGVFGHGILQITGGGQLQSGSGQIGTNSGSLGEVTVSGVGSTWTSTGQLHVAVAGQATLDITNGGHFIGISTFIRNNGAVTVSGTGSQFSFSDFISVNFGGKLDVTSGGEVSNTAGSVSGTATVSGAGAVWTNSGSLGINGVLNVLDGGKVTATGVTIGTSGELHGDGTVQVGGAGVVQNGGIVAPGTSPGTLHITGNYVQTSAGELAIELASPSSYDQLFVSVDATLAGNLQVSLVGGYVPNAGQSFTLMQADDIVGMFGTTILPSVPNMTFSLTYNPTNVLLKALPTLAGDFNLDGKVDAADYVVWRKNPGGLLTPTDYTTWRTHFGQPPGSGAGSGTDTGLSSRAVPEPSSVSAFLLAAASLLVIPRFGSARIVAEDAGPMC